VVYNIAKHNKPFLDSEFVKQCMVDVVEALCPESEIAFENISLSRRTTVCHLEETNSDYSSLWYWMVILTQVT